MNGKTVEPSGTIRFNSMILSRRMTMQWEKPEFAEISLACEIGSYANAELEAALTPAHDEAKAESE
jgi:coenzyme PQQ precursor peptide PqqA